MRDLFKKEAPALLMVLAPFVVLPFLWDALPAQVPIRWSASGDPIGYGPKAVGLLLLPGVNAGVYVLLLVFPKIDPKKRVAWDQKPLPALRFFTVLLLAVLHFVTLAAVLGGDGTSEGSLIPLVCTLLFLVMGNYLGAVPPNYFLGVRTPWTLEDPAIWRRTHRLAGRLWVAVSVVLLVLWLLVDAAAFGPIFTAGVLLMAFVPVAYSFYLWNARPADAS